MAGSFITSFFLVFFSLDIDECQWRPGYGDEEGMRPSMRPGDEGGMRPSMRPGDEEGMGPDDDEEGMRPTMRSDDEGGMGPGDEGGMRPSMRPGDDEGMRPGDEEGMMPCGRNKICLNTPGSFECVCEEGYRSLRGGCRGR